MKILLTGSQGQVGQALCLTQPAAVELIACSRHELDITDSAQVNAVVSQHRPDWIINAAAYTAVDQAETDREQCFAINAEGVRHLAQAAKNAHARLLHLSTDYVFDGAQATPYEVTDKTNPLNVYGESKVFGERYVQALLPDTGVILRTSWIYSAQGHNFVKTILRLLQEKDSLAIVSDQIGTPTWSVNLARFIWHMLDYSIEAGIYHFTDAGIASWYDFAVAIQEESGLEREKAIIPITSHQFKTTAQRPAMSVLDKQMSWQACHWRPSHWRSALRSMLAQGQGDNNAI